MLLSSVADGRASLNDRQTRRQAGDRHRGRRRERRPACRAFARRSRRRHPRHADREAPGVRPGHRLFDDARRPYPQRQRVRHERLCRRSRAFLAVAAAARAGARKEPAKNLRAAPRLRRLPRQRARRAAAGGGSKRAAAHRVGGMRRGRHHRGRRRRQAGQRHQPDRPCRRACGRPRGASGRRQGYRGPPRFARPTRRSIRTPPC